MYYPVPYSYVLPVTFITILLSRTSHHIQRREKAQNEWALYREQNNTEDSLNTELISQKQQQMITHSKDTSRRSSQFTRYNRAHSFQVWSAPTPVSCA